MATENTYIVIPKSNIKDSDSQEAIVYRFFKFIEEKKMDNLLALFDYDAKVYEPFSNAHGLHGKSSIEPFLKVAMMANSNMHHKIEISDSEKNDSDGQTLTALVTFELGDKTKARFVFDLLRDELNAWKIKTLIISFVT